MQSTHETVKAWLDTFSPVETLAENPAALSKEFDTIVGVFSRSNASSDVIDRSFQRVKVTSQSRAWPTAAQVHEAMTFVCRDNDGTAQIGNQRGDRGKLSGYDLEALDRKIIPTARRWLREAPGLRAHAFATLTYWNEPLIDDNGKKYDDPMLKKPS